MIWFHKPPLLQNVHTARDAELGMKILLGRRCVLDFNPNYSRPLSGNRIEAAFDLPRASGTGARQHLRTPQMRRSFDLFTIETHRHVEPCGIVRRREESAQFRNVLNPTVECDIAIDQPAVRRRNAVGRRTYRNQRIEAFRKTLFPQQ